jgi:hypothetical protein
MLPWTESPGSGSNRPIGWHATAPKGISVCRRAIAQQGFDRLSPLACLQNYFDFAMALFVAGWVTRFAPVRRQPGQINVDRRKRYLQPPLPPGRYPFPTSRDR